MEDKCTGACMYACKHVCKLENTLRNAVIARHADTRTLAVRLTRAAYVRSKPLRDADRNRFAQPTSATETKKVEPCCVVRRGGAFLAYR